MLPILLAQTRHVTAALARSAGPHAPARQEGSSRARSAGAGRRSAGRARQAAAAALRRSADRLAPT